MTKREQVIEWLNREANATTSSDRHSMRCRSALALIADMTAEIVAGRNCVEPDPIYGWKEPRHLDADEPEWLDLAAARTAVDAWDKEADRAE